MTRSLTEALTRLVLWLWVVVVFPATLTALIDLAFAGIPGSRCGPACACSTP
jgi:hypothetical protein